VTPFGASPFELRFRLRVTGSGGPWELELPGVYVDAILADASTARPVLCNRLPEGGETSVPRGTSIQVDVSDPQASGINASATWVWVGGQLAFDGSSFQAGWNGGGSSTASRDSGQTLRITVDPTSDFASEALVTVRVVSRTNDGATIDQSYWFRIEDYTAPRLTSALAWSRSVVRVEFSEPVVASEALHPQSWSIGVVGGPRVSWGEFRSAAAVWVDVSSVTQVSDRVFDVVTDIPMTMRAVYRVTAGSIHDLRGNVVDPLASSLDFESVDSRPAERHLELVEMVPAMNLREDDTHDLRKLLWAWQEPIELVLCLVDEWLQVLDPETAPEPYLDAMLADLGNPFTFSLSIEQKRRLIGLLVPIYRQKGTGEGIVSTVRLFLGLDVTINYPCFEGAPLGFAVLGGDDPGDDPGTFVLGGSAFDHYGYEVVSGILLTDDQREKVRGIAEYMQAANEHLIAILEPTDPSPVPDHLELGISELGVNWILHA
jgi:phage tail-like protein